MDSGPTNPLLSETSEDEDILPSDDDEIEDDPLDPDEQDSDCLQGSEEVVELEEEEDEEEEEEEEEEQEEEEDLEDLEDESKHSVEGQADEQTRDHFYYMGRDGSTKWHRTPPDRSTRCQLLTTEAAGTKGPAKEAATIVQMWKCFVTDEILDIIVTHTNEKIFQVCKLYGLEPQNEVTNKCEVVGAIGLLYLAGVFSSSRMKLEEFWAEDGSGVEIFRAAMSLERFRFLIKNLRFDDGVDSKNRKKLDKLASVRRILDIFTYNCGNCYSIGETATLDEVRESFRGRCSFKRFMLDKPVHYGFKVYALCDSRNYYTLNLDVVADPVKQDRQLGITKTPEQIVRRLVGPIKGTGRIVTMDSTFSSVALAKMLMEEFRLASVGNLSRKHPEIPSKFLDVRRRHPMTSMIGHSGEMTLCSYLPENDGIFLVLSTADKSARIVTKEGGDEANEPPELINFYNLTSGCVDDVDEMCGKYSAARNCRSMPLTIFFALLNVAGVNTQVLYQQTYGDRVVRRRFLKSLAIALVWDGSQDRHGKLGSSLDNGSQTKRLLVSGPESASKKFKPGPTRCSFCPRSRDRKTHTHCGKCNRAICKEHSESVCKECFKKVCVNKDN